MITFACVLFGDKYAPADVERLLAMVGEHAGQPFAFRVLTDDPQSLAHLDASVVNVTRYGLTGWWPKMLLFNPAVRGPGRVVYLDLDTVICGDLGPLCDVDVPFAICRNFTQVRQARSSNVTWPCRYGSAVMVFNDGWGADVWRRFDDDRERFMAEAGRKGDQWVIEQLVEDAALLQDVLPDGYFLHYRDLNEHPNAPPPQTSVVVYAGGSTPDTIGPPWALNAWTNTEAVV